MPAIEGVFLRLTPEEAQELYAQVEAAGFERSGEGVKLFLFALMQEEDEEPSNLADALQGYFADNPHHAALIRAGAGKLFEAIRKKML